IHSAATSSGRARTRTGCRRRPAIWCEMAQYRAGIIGLGWMGLLYDLAPRIDTRFQVDDIDRPTPELNLHRRFHYFDHPGEEGLPSTYAEALRDRPEVSLVAGADRDPKRLQAFAERYGVSTLYTDAVEMLRREKLDIVAITTPSRRAALSRSTRTGPTSSTARPPG